MMVISATYRTCAHCCLRPQRVTLTSAFMGRSALPRLRRDRGAQSHRAVHRTSLSTASTTATGEGTSQQAPASCTFPSPSPTLASSSVASPSTSPPTACSVTLLCSSVFDTHRVAALVSAAVSAGDVLLLWGDVGAGKSEFARGFLRAWTAQPQLTVRSPTYTLMHDYAHGQLTSATCTAQHSAAQQQHSLSSSAASLVTDAHAGMAGEMCQHHAPRTHHPPSPSSPLFALPQRAPPRLVPAAGGGRVVGAASPAHFPAGSATLHTAAMAAAVAARPLRCRPLPLLTRRRPVSPVCRRVFGGVARASAFLDTSARAVGAAESQGRGGEQVGG